MRGYSAIGLSHPKNSINVGAVLRAAGCYESALVAHTGKRYSEAPTDTMKSVRKIPLIRVETLYNAIPYGCVPVAIDLIEGAEPLHKYKHPQRAFYIFGPEDGTLGKSVTDFCRDIVYVPTNRCMNLAACVNVVLYDRMSKQMRGE